MTDGQRWTPRVTVRVWGRIHKVPKKKEDRTSFVGAGFFYGRITLTHRPEDRLGNSPAMECVICLNPTSHYVVPCRHVLCSKCATRWFAIKTICPVCRQVPCGHAHGRALKGPDAGAIWTLCVGRPWRQVVVGVRWRMRPGITLATRDGAVTVTKVDPLGNCHVSGLRRGDVLLHINGIHLTSHDTTADIMDRCTSHGVEMRIGVRTRHGGGTWRNRLQTTWARVTGSRAPPVWSLAS